MTATPPGAHALDAKGESMHEFRSAAAPRRTAAGTDSRRGRCSSRSRNRGRGVAEENIAKGSHGRGGDAVAGRAPVSPSERLPATHRGVEGGSGGG
nr:unnamed protein product [Digitaria exilis]